MDTESVHPHSHVIACALIVQEAGERWQRRSNMILHMKTVLEELKIGFQLPCQEITVTGIPLLDVPHTFS
jgi:hypothetical protein